MAEFIEKLKQPFEESLNYQVSRLNKAVEEMNGQKEVISRWPVRKNRIARGIIKPLGQWRAMLKQMTRPMIWKRYKREKKRLLQAKNLTWFHWRGFIASTHLAALRILNIIRILLILGFSIGVLLLVGYVIVKVFGLIGKVG